MVTGYPSATLGVSGKQKSERFDVRVICETPDDAARRLLTPWTRDNLLSRT